MVSPLGFMRLRRRRLLRDCILSIPAIVAPLAVVLLVSQGRYASLNGELIDRYCEAAEAACSAEEYETADLYYRRLVQLNSRHPGFTYELAVIASQQQDWERTHALMTRIAAPPISYGPANLWLADELSKRLEDASPEDRLLIQEQIKQYLLRVVDRQPDHYEAQFRLGQLQLAQGEVEQAVEHLTSAIPEHPELGLSVAKLELVRGNRDQARLLAEAAETHFAAKVEAEAADTESLRNLALAKIFLERFDEAEQLLLKAMEDSDDVGLRRTLADIYVVKLGRLPESDSARRFELLQTALGYQPDNPAALQMLASMALQDGEQLEAARELAKDLLARGIAPAITHFILGTLEAKAGQFNSASLHLRQAQKADPNAAQVANNLAWVLTQADPPQWDEALRMADNALRLSPQDPEFCATRGQILAKLERWEDCIPNLELAVRCFPDRANLHATLAEAYRELGDVRLAEKHEALAAEAARSRKEP